MRLNVFWCAFKNTIESFALYLLYCLSLIFSYLSYLMMKNFCNGYYELDELVDLYECMYQINKEAKGIVN